MKRLFCAALLGVAFAVTPAAAQDSGAAKPRVDAAQTAEKADKKKVKEGSDCDTGRAGVRCSRPKPRKPWFFGKA